MSHFERRLYEERRITNAVIQEGPRLAYRHSGRSPTASRTLTDLYLRRRGLVYSRRIMWASEPQARLCLIIAAWRPSSSSRNGTADDAVLATLGLPSLIPKVGTKLLSEAQKLAATVYAETGSVRATMRVVAERGYKMDASRVREAVYAETERTDKETAVMAASWVLHGPAAGPRFGLSEEEYEARVQTVIPTREARAVAEDFLSGTSLADICARYFIDTQTAKTYCCMAVWVFRVELDLNDPVWGAPLTADLETCVHILLEGTQHTEMLNEVRNILFSVDRWKFAPLRQAIKNAIARPGDNIREKPVGQGKRTKAHIAAQRLRGAERRKELEEKRAADPIKVRRARRERERRAREREAREAAKVAATASKKEAQIPPVAGGSEPERPARKRVRKV